MLLVPPLQAIGQPQADIEIARRGAAVGLPALLALLTFVFMLIFAAYPMPQLIVIAVVVLLLIGAGKRGSIDHKMGVAGRDGGQLLLCCSAVVVCMAIAARSASPTCCCAAAHSLFGYRMPRLILGANTWASATLAKVVSPSKTIEGMLCSLLSGAIVVSVFAPFLNWEVSFYVYPLVGIVGALLAHRRRFTRVGMQAFRSCQRFRLYPAGARRLYSTAPMVC